MGNTRFLTPSFNLPLPSVRGQRGAKGEEGRGGGGYASRSAAAGKRTLDDDGDDGGGRRSGGLGEGGGSFLGCRTRPSRRRRRLKDRRVPRLPHVIRPLRFVLGGLLLMRTDKTLNECGAKCPNLVMQYFYVLGLGFASSAL